ncbi:hypothetical protein Taro_049042 [Colocasia esculenta]|uniref:Uncharacterized protein n=1 Tax=Colocasia esculenta TaxID=4460 RepID=A0A843X9Z4_COLES|nr:hypothetical protein [Colocasia esculenta]
MQRTPIYRADPRPERWMRLMRVQPPRRLLRSKLLTAPWTSFTTFWGRVEELLVAGELWIDHKKAIFFPFLSASTCVNRPLGVDQSSVKETKANIIVHEYEMFRMSPHTQATVIEDSKNLSSLTVEELIESLMTYEINMKREEVEQPSTKKKDVVLKAKKYVSSSEEKSPSGAEEEIAKLPRTFRKILRKKRLQFTMFSRDFKGKSKQGEPNKKNEMICYES